MKKVIWKIIPPYSDYMASNYGDIKSLKFGKEIIMKSNPDKDGYAFLNLSKNGKSKGFRVNVLVAMAFLGHVPCGLKKVVDHKNDIKSDNRLSNLQIITSRRNTIKSVSGGSSKYCGVSFDEKSKKWRSHITFNKRLVHLGSFSNELLASKHYEDALTLIEIGNYTPPPLRIKSSSHKGVSWSKQHNKWIAYFYQEGKRIYLGIFASEQEAINAKELGIKQITQ